MNIANAKEVNIIHSIPPVLVRGDKCAVDTEWFGMSKKRLHRPHGRFACATFCFNDKDVYIVTDVNDLEQAFKNIDAAVHVYVHAKFDITQLRKYIYLPQRKNLWDCMLLEQIMWSGYFTDFSLADMVRRYLDVYMPKETRAQFSENESCEMTREQEEYACLDTLYTRKVFKAQKEKISDSDLSIWRDIELPFLWTILAMGGVKLDTEKWLALARSNEENAKAIQDKYEINLNSPKQVKEHFASLGVFPKGTDIENLEYLAGDEKFSIGVHNFASDMMSYRSYAKRASTYGEKFITDYVEPDGKIYADLYQIGAETGRTSCRAPNLQNQPHESSYRDCFIADGGNVMIVADWGAQEPRIAAYLSQDADLMDALNSDEKLYIRIARDVLGKKIKKDSEEYKHMKSTVLGIFYGMQAKALAKRLGIDEKSAQEMIDMFLETYPGVQEYIKRQHKAKDYVESIYGRKIWLNKYSFQWMNNALNAPIQSSAADAMKIAARRFLDYLMLEMGDYEPNEDPKFYQDMPLTLLVHDEIVIQVPKEIEDTVKKILEISMISVAEEMHDGIKGSIEIFSGTSWACKH
jgi:DNA polymerase I-like protein with 3'-5' exonuclease and polymerase domains